MLMKYECRLGYNVMKIPKETSNTVVTGMPQASNNWHKEQSCQ